MIAAPNLETCDSNPVVYNGSVKIYCCFLPQLTFSQNLSWM
jgi:hypothetical protein